ncbi:Fasciclin domain containing protein [Naviculisporaceae sp. PSN 640]
MFGHKTYGLLPASLLALLAVLPVGLAWSIFESREAKEKPLNQVLASEKSLSTYYDLVKQYPDILLQLPSYSGVTLVAPDNDAFEKFHDWDPQNKTLVTNLLEYHILQGTVSTASVPVGVSTFAPTLLTDRAYSNVTGGQQMLINKGGDDVVVFTSGLGSRSTVVKPDLAFKGGLIQIVDTLMVPPARLEPTARDAYKDLQSFLGALYTADLVSEFADSTDVTIFAPRNSAFQIVAGTLEDLSKDELADILRYHLVPKQVMSSTEFQNGTNLTTASDAIPDLELHVIRSGNNMYFNRAQLLQPDILIANGVVHIIDAVLNPAAAAATPDPAIGTQAPVFPVTGSKTATGTKVPVPFTTGLPCTSDCPITSSAVSEPTGTADGPTTTSTGFRGSSSNGAGGFAARCTGVPAAGVAAAMLVGAVGMDFVGLV